MLILFISLYLLLLSCKAYLSLRYKKHFDKPDKSAFDGSDVTIVQPILSGDPLLEQCLEHNLHFSEVSFLWLIDEDDAEAQRIAQILQTKYSTIQVLPCPPAPQDLNPKAYKLQLALDHVRTEYLAIVDDDTKLSKEGLTQALYSLKSSNATIVTGLPYYSSGDNLWSILVAHFVNNNSIVTYLPLLNFMEPLSINGMFYVMARGRLEPLGSFKTIWNQLSDDFAMAKLVKHNGGKIIQTPTTHAVQTSVKDSKHYSQLMHRWFLFAQTQVLEQNLAIRVLLIFMLAVPPLLLWMIVVTGIYSLIVAMLNLSLASLLLSIICLGVFAIVRHFILNYLHRQFLTEQPKFSIPLSLLAELLQPFHMIHALFQKHIVWRSRKIRLEDDGRFSYIQDTIK